MVKEPEADSPFVCDHLQTDYRAKGECLSAGVQPKDNCSPPGLDRAALQQSSAGIRDCLRFT